MVKSKQTHNAGPHIFETDAHCHHRYQELLKESRIWNNSGQYWLGREAEILAEQLLKGDKSAATIIVRTEQHVRGTRRLL